MVVFERRGRLRWARGEGWEATAWAAWTRGRASRVKCHLVRYEPPAERALGRLHDSAEAHLAGGCRVYYKEQRMETDSLGTGTVGAVGAVGVVGVARWTEGG